MTIEFHLALIKSRIERIAAREAASHDLGTGLERSLAVLSDTGRRHVTMLLDRIKAFSEDPHERAAADQIRQRAARAWYGDSVSFGAAGKSTD